MQTVWIGVVGGDCLGYECSIRDGAVFSSREKLENWMEEQKEKGVEYEKMEEDEDGWFGWQYFDERESEYIDIVGKEIEVK